MNYQQFMDLPLLWTTDNFILMLIYQPKVLKWPCPIKDRNGVFIPVQNMTSSIHIHKCVWKYWDMQTSLCLRFFSYNSKGSKNCKYFRASFGFTHMWISWHLPYLSWKVKKILALLENEFGNGMMVKSF